MQNPTNVSSASAASSDRNRPHPWIQSLTALATALSCLGLAWVLVQVWREPMAWDDGSWVPYGVGIMVMEFLILHSSVFVGTLAAGDKPPAQKLAGFAGLLALYGLMGLGIALSTDSLSLLWLLLAIMISRFSTATQNQPSKLHRRAAFGIAVYITGCRCVLSGSGLDGTRHDAQP